MYLLILTDNLHDVYLLFWASIEHSTENEIAGIQAALPVAHLFKAHNYWDQFENISFFDNLSLLVVFFSLFQKKNFQILIKLRYTPLRWILSNIS